MPHWRVSGGQCGIVSEEVAQLLHAEGIEEASEFYGAYVCDNGKLCAHAWVTLPGGYILDSTADQFGFDGGGLLLRPGQIARYREDWDGNLRA